MSDLPEFAMSKFSAHEDITEQNVANVVILKVVIFTPLVSVNAVDLCACKVHE